METTLSYCRTSDEVHIWTSDTMLYTKFDRLCNAASDFYRCADIAKDTDGDVISKTCIITDKKMLSFRTGRAKQKLTEEQRAARLRGQPGLLGEDWIEEGERDDTDKGAD